MWTGIFSVYLLRVSLVMRVWKLKLLEVVASSCRNLEVSFLLILIISHSLAQVWTESPFFVRIRKGINVPKYCVLYI